MKVLIVKLGATGDVVRTTPLLRHLPGDVIWLTEAKNLVLLRGLARDLTCFSWEDRKSIPNEEYDLIINLEDTLEAAMFASQVQRKQLFGAYADQNNLLRYTDDSCRWFDLSLISRYGREEADKLKYLNRRSYQDLIFDGLGLSFDGQRYMLPTPEETGLRGDIAIASEVGSVWPMKAWANYSHLKQALEERGLIVNILPKRSSLLAHLADVRNHTCLVGGDSLPMHFALGTGRRCISLFNCTSPWEIYDYNVQLKVVSPLLEQFFYKRDFDARATTAIPFEEVLAAVTGALQDVGSPTGNLCETAR